MSKTTIRVLTLFGLIVTLGSRGAMAQSQAHFTIPFSFAVGSKSFAAGEYRVTEVAPQILLIDGDHGNSHGMVVTNTDEPEKIPGNATMSFHRYGDRYFLFKVSNDTHGWGLPKSVREKELIAQQVSSKHVDLNASLNK
jgi:hypothetical protein